MNLHKSQFNSNWVIAAASVIGNSHIKENIPCQDFWYYKNLNKDCGIAVVSDGAGSCENSHFGSRHVAHIAVDFFEKELLSNDWLNNNTLPDIKEWNDLAKKVLFDIKTDLEDYADYKKYSFKSLSCTIIVVIYFPFGLLVTHIGDGRAGYCDENNEWKSIITPYHGEEANQTVFITSEIWDKKDIDNFIECRIIDDKIKAFCLLSDGCEKASFECNLYDKESGMYFDPNKPFHGFFNPVKDTVFKLYKEGKNDIEISEIWEEFLYNGNPKFISETDDKTMIIAIRNI